MNHLPFCPLHDPQLREQRKQERPSARARLSRLQTLLSQERPEVCRRVLELLLTTNKVSMGDLEFALGRYQLVLELCEARRRR